MLEIVESEIPLNEERNTPDGAMPYQFQPKNRAAAGNIAVSFRIFYEYTVAGIMANSSLHLVPPLKVRLWKTSLGRGATRRRQQTQLRANCLISPTRSV